MGAMAQTDTEIRTSETRKKAYRLSDSGGMYPVGYPTGGKLAGLGPIVSVVTRSS